MCADPFILLTLPRHNRGFVAGGVQGRAKHLSEESRQITQSPTTLFKNTPLHLSAY